MQTALPLQPEVFCASPAAPTTHRRQDVWPAHMLARESRCWPSGHAALDAHLPGGGWPLEGMVELLQARMHLQAGTHLWALLAPALARRLHAQQNRAGPVVLIGPPQQPFGPALRAQGLASDRLLCIHTDDPTARLWAAEQALRCADVAAVLAWLPHAKSTQLQRLNVLAQDRLLFVMRDAKVQHDASPARLRILLGGADQMELRILKRRGPPLAQPIYLPAQSVHLQRLLESRPKQEPAPERIGIVRVATHPFSAKSEDALDRAATA